MKNTIEALVVYYPESGQTRYFDRFGKEYSPAQVDGLGNITPISRKPMTSFQPSLPTVKVPDTFANSNTAQKAGIGKQALDFLSSIFRKKDGSNTFVGDLTADLVKGRAQVVGTQQIPIGNGTVNNQGVPTWQPVNAGFTPNTQNNNMTPVYVGGAILATGLLFLALKK